MRATKKKSVQDSGDEPKAFSSVCWVLCEAPLDVETSVAFTFLDYLLVGTDAAPLMKAVNDSALGESVVGGGTDDTLRQPTFTMGLKGVKPEDVDKARSLRACLHSLLVCSHIVFFHAFVSRSGVHVQRSA